MQSSSQHGTKKIISLPNSTLLSKLSQKKVLVGGCFDIFHYGHLIFLQHAKAHGELLIVLLESDEFIQSTKQRQPVHTQQQRAEILAHLDIVDYVVTLPVMKNNEEYFDLVKQIKPSVIAVTEGDSKIDLKKQQAKEVGAQVEVVTSLLPFSSSSYASFFRDRSS